MIIVYLSIALAVIAILYLCVSAAKTVKNLNPIIQSLSGTAAGVHKQMEGVLNEVDQLKKKAEEFRVRIDEGKSTVRDVVESAKGSVEEARKFWQLARTVPNPKKVEKVALSPEVKRTNDRLLAVYTKWKQLRNERTHGKSL
ncbi:MAG TPA: DUF948 domain-containing protein [Bacillales bacterium]|nr:DUF948 domain-containing protein [Bacillales bacterium]